MCLQFNAIIPLEIWEWEEGKSSVYMRFGVKELGNWELDIGPGVLVRLDYCLQCAANILSTLYRDAGDGLHVIIISFQVDYEFIRSNKCYGIPYKYVVFSPKNQEVGHPYEHLYGAPPYDYPQNNRLLKVPEYKICPGGKQVALSRE